MRRRPRYPCADSRSIPYSVKPSKSPSVNAIKCPLKNPDIAVFRCLAQDVADGSDGRIDQQIVDVVRDGDAWNLSSHPSAPVLGNSMVGDAMRDDFLPACGGGFERRPVTCRPGACRGRRCRYQRKAFPRSSPRQPRSGLLRCRRMPRRCIRHLPQQGHFLHQGLLSGT